jgi:ferredoxin--NADP+ reductase
LKIKARGLGNTRQIEADTVIFAIGDTVDKEFSLPTFGDAYSINEHPSFPVDGISFEAYDIDADVPIKGVFLAGWARKASTGLVGVARKDGETAAQAVLQYLETQPPLPDAEIPYKKFIDWVMANLHQVVTKKDIIKLIEAEQKEILVRGVEDYKFATNEDMLQVMAI